MADSELGPFVKGSVQDFVQGLPKAEVHLHLEGCIPTELVSVAAARSGVCPPVETVGGCPQVSNLADLLSYLDFSCGLVASGEEMEQIAYSTAARLSRSGAGHGDVIFNPSHWPQWKDRLHLMLGALEAGAESAEADGLSTLSFCLSLRRQQSASEAGELVDFLLENRSERLVALSIDGNEARGSNTEAFVEAFARAARAGLRRTAHAGESSGPAGVREAVELLGAERIDHGIRCEDDALLVAELADRRIPLGICPSSNVALGVVASLAEHPIDRLRRAGVPVSVNTDDPELYGIELSGEYAACAREFSWGPCELAELARTSIDSSFATEERKQTLTIKLDKYLTSYSQDLVS